MAWKPVAETFARAVPVATVLGDCVTLYLIGIRLIELVPVLFGSNVKHPYIRYPLFPTIFGPPIPSYVPTPVSVSPDRRRPLEIRTISECGAHRSLSNGCQNSTCHCSPAHMLCLWMGSGIQVAI